MNLLKSLFIITTLCFCFNATAQLRGPALSPAATVKQTIGLTDIEVNYARPGVKGRKIFATDGLVPYGKVWRTGANGATKINFEDDVTVGGQPLAKGTYVILTTPGQTSWSISFYPHEDRKSWSKYKKDEPALTINTLTKTSKEKVENFSISFDNLKLDEGEMILAWDFTKVNILIQTKTSEQMSKAIKHTMDGPSINDYFQAAVYLHEANEDLNQALTYIKKVNASEKSRFFHHYREAIILRDLKKNKEALVAANRALESAKKAENGDFIRLNERLIAELN